MQYVVRMQSACKFSRVLFYQIQLLTHLDKGDTVRENMLQNLLAMGFDVTPSVVPNSRRPQLAPKMWPA